MMMDKVKLKEALDDFDSQYLADGVENYDIIFQAATAYLDLLEKDMVIVPKEPNENQLNAALKDCIRDLSECLLHVMVSDAPFVLNNGQDALSRHAEMIRGCD